MSLPAALFDAEFEEMPGRPAERIWRVRTHPDVESVAFAVNDVVVIGPLHPADGVVSCRVDVGSDPFHPGPNTLTYVVDLGSDRDLVHVPGGLKEFVIEPVADIGGPLPAAVQAAILPPENAVWPHVREDGAFGAWAQAVMARIEALEAMPSRTTQPPVVPAVEEAFRTLGRALGLAT